MDIIENLDDIRKMQSPRNPPLSIFFDGGCRVCAWEIKKYLAMDTTGKLATIDINHPDFSAEKFGLDRAAVRKYFHVLTQDGRVIAGVDAFIEIWKTLGTPKALLATRIARLPPFYGAMKLGYRVFVELRPYLPRTHSDASAPACDDSSCERTG